MLTRALCWFFFIFFFYETKLLQAVSSEHLVIFPAVHRVCWRGQSVCSIHTLLFKCHYAERESPARRFKASLARGVIWSDWSKNVLMPPFNFDLRRLGGRLKSVAGQTVDKLKCWSHKGGIVYESLINYSVWSAWVNPLNIWHVDIYCEVSAM